MERREVERVTVAYSIITTVRLPLPHETFPAIYILFLAVALVRCATESLLPFLSLSSSTEKTLSGSLCGL